MLSYDMVIKWIHISVYIYIYKPIKVCNVSPSDIGPVVPGKFDINVFLNYFPTFKKCPFI